MFEWKYTRSGPCFSSYRENHYFQSHMDFASSFNPFPPNSCGRSCSKDDLGCACPCVFYVMFNVCGANLSSLVTAKGIRLWLRVRSCYLFTWYFSFFIVWMMRMSDFVISFFPARLQALGGQGQNLFCWLSSLMSGTELTVRTYFLNKQIIKIVFQQILNE